MSEPQVIVRDSPDEHAYVIEVDGVRAGKAVYHLRGGRHIFVHTEVDDAWSGHGLGSKLAAYALDDVRAHGGSVVALCPFIAAYIRRHPEYQDIVDEELTAQISRDRA